MRRAVRAGIILRAQRADARLLRPFKHDVRARNFRLIVRRMQKGCLTV